MRVPQHIQQMLKKLQQLPPAKVAEVEDFIDFLSSRDVDRPLVKAAQAVSEASLTAVWDNDDDADYDRL
ncbi:MAG: toxin-antitoxin system, antitoxin component, Xre family protein [Pseudomonadota bacterium]